MVRKPLRPETLFKPTGKQDRPAYEPEVQVPDPDKSDVPQLAASESTQCTEVVGAKGKRCAFKREPNSQKCKMHSRKKKH